MKGFKKHQRLTKRQIRVFSHAKRWLKKKSWYRGVCMDNFPTDEEIKNDFRTSVFRVIVETQSWDNPNYYCRREDSVLQTT